MIELLLSVLAGSLAIVVLAYIVARVVTRAVLRTKREWRNVHGEEKKAPRR